MSSLLAPLPSSLSDHHFVGDLASLLERRKLKGGDAQSLDKFASELASSGALRSDLFALCSAISHLSAEDLSPDELLLLVARALNGPGVAADSAVEEIPVAVRSVFQEAYEQWSSCRSAVTESSSWPSARVAAMFDAPLRADELAEEDCELVVDLTADVATNFATDKEPGDSLPTIQAALGMARRRTLEGMISEDTALSEGLSSNAVHEEAAPWSFGEAVLRISFAGQAQAGQSLAEGGRPRLGVRLPVRGLIVCAFVLAIAGGFTGGCVYQTLHAGTARVPSAKVVPLVGGSGRVLPPVSAAADADAASAAALNLPRSSGAVAMKPAAQLAVRKPVSPAAGASVLPRLDQQAGALYASSASATSTTASSGAATKPAVASGANDVADLTNQLNELPHVPPTSVMPYALSTPNPIYPAEQPRGISGTVVVEASLSRQGNITGAWAVSGPDELRPAAIQAVQAWRFRPYLIEGSPAAVTTTFGFFFNGR